MRELFEPGDKSIGFVDQCSGYTLIREAHRGVQFNYGFAPLRPATISPVHEIVRRMTKITGKNYVDSFDVS